jgi:twinkle protein
VVVTGEAAELWQESSVEPLKARGITAETCQRYGYRIHRNGSIVRHVAPIYKGRELAAVKLRGADKKFSWVGKSQEFFGQQLFPTGGKVLTITEGEIDALSMSQAFGNKYAVVSVTSGAQSALKQCKTHYEWIDLFESVVLCFDMDEAGQEAAKACAEILPAGKVKIMSLPLKDASEMLVSNRVDELVKAFWNAKPFKPDGVVDGSEIWDEIIAEDINNSVPYPFEGLNDKLKGLRLSELVVLTSGSGMGKSAIAREIAYSLIQQGKKVGMIMLEESIKRTALGLMGLHAMKPLHISREGVTEAQMREAYEATVGSGNCYLFDHFGSTDVDNLLQRIRYMSKALDCKYIILDHLSIVVSGLDGHEDERRTIDRAMTLLRTLVQEAGISLILISHLKRVEGSKRSHEEGGITSLSHLRGSQAIGQLADAVIGVERDQQGEDPNKATLRILKNRFTGETGVCGTLRYDRDTGRLTEDLTNRMF